jgi:hypothetical protein
MGRTSVANPTFASRLRQEAIRKALNTRDRDFPQQAESHIRSRRNFWLQRLLRQPAWAGHMGQGRNSDYEMNVFQWR